MRGREGERGDRRAKQTRCLVGKRKAKGKGRAAWQTRMKLSTVHERQLGNGGSAWGSVASRIPRAQARHWHLAPMAGTLNSELRHICKSHQSLHHPAGDLYNIAAVAAAMTMLCLVDTKRSDVQMFGTRAHHVGYEILIAGRGLGSRSWARSRPERLPNTGLDIGKRLMRRK
jgi:hypothetical protein